MIAIRLFDADNDAGFVYSAILRRKRAEAVATGELRGDHTKFFIEARRDLDDELSSTAVKTHIAYDSEDADELYGFIVVCRDAGELSVKHLYVKLAFRGFGVEEALMKQASRA